MKDIEETLSQHQPKPRRPISANFTQTIASEVHSRRQPNVWQKLRSSLPAGLFTKAGAAAMASFVLVSGTVAALTLWPRPDVQPTMHTQLPSGNRIVGYDAKNCNYFSSLNGQTPTESSEKLYYEIRKDAQLTDQQLQDSLRAVCEENLSNNATTAIINQLPKNVPGGVQSTLAYTIDSISKDSLTVTLDSHYNAAQYTTKPRLTYTKFSKDLLLYNQSNKADFSDFKAGDTIKMVVQDTTGRSTETPEQYNPLNHPENITILAMVEIPPLTADPAAFYTAVGGYLVRLEPCTSNPTGLCRAYDFVQ